MGKLKFVNQAAVASRIRIEYERRHKEAYAIMQFYAIQAMIYFKEVQTDTPAEERGAFWTNHTFMAATGFFAKAFQVPGSVGLTFANTTSYAKDLEEGFDGRFASFPTLLAKFEPLILRDLQILYGGQGAT